MRIFSDLIRFPYYLFHLYAVLIFGLAACPIYTWKGPNETILFGFAVFTCWFGGVLAIISINIARYTLLKGHFGIIIGMFCRMGIPLTVATVLAFCVKKDFSFFVLLSFLVVYFLMQPLDVWLTLRQLKSIQAENKDIENVQQQSEHS